MRAGAPGPAPGSSHGAAVTQPAGALDEGGALDAGAPQSEGCLTTGAYAGSTRAITRPAEVSISANPSGPRPMGANDHAVNATIAAAT